MVISKFPVDHFDRFALHQSAMRPGIIMPGKQRRPCSGRNRHGFNEAIRVSAATRFRIRRKFAVLNHRRSTVLWPAFSEDDFLAQYLKTAFTDPGPPIRNGRNCSVRNAEPGSIAPGDASAHENNAAIASRRNPPTLPARVRADAKEGVRLAFCALVRIEPKAARQTAEAS